jgi:thiol-disulfide isomerase/thioredoxin
MKDARAAGLVALAMFLSVGCGRATRIATGPPIGAEPPEVVAADWLNTDSPQTLSGLRGNVVLVEFWATWCGPCVAGIPHMNELQKKYHGDGLRVVSFTEENRATVEAFQKGARSPIEYTIGVGSNLDRTYGVTGIPHAFVIGRNGKLLWEGHPATPECEAKIAAALAEKEPQG